MFVWQLSAWVQSCFSFSRSAVVVFPNAVFVVIFDVFALDRFRRSCPLYSFRFEGPESGKRGDWGRKTYCYVGRCSRFRFDITFASNEGVNFIRTAFCEFTTMSKIFYKHEGNTVSATEYVVAYTTILFSYLVLACLFLHVCCTMRINFFDERICDIYGALRCDISWR